MMLKMGITKFHKAIFKDKKKERKLLKSKEYPYYQIPYDEGYWSTVRYIDSNGFYRIIEEGDRVIKIIKLFKVVVKLK